MTLMRMLNEHFVEPHLANELNMDGLIKLNGKLPESLDVNLKLGDSVECNWPSIGVRTWPVDEYYAR